MSAKLTRIISGFTFAALVISAAALPARAADEAVTVSRLASTAGLNLAAPSDQAVLRHRINVAAEIVCHLSNPGEGGLSSEMTGCISAARAGAWAKAEVKIAAARSRSQIAAK